MLSYPVHHSLRHLLADWRARPRAAVAALVMATRGSSYRKPGALALIDNDGLVAGCISGGCLEADLVAAAQTALATGEIRRASFDTRSDEDRWFGSQSGCRGETEVLLWPSGGPRHPLLDALVAADEAHQVLFVDARADPPQILSSTVGPASADCVRIAPPPRLLLLGGGPEAPALLALARTLGWHVDLIEHRARYLADARLADADRLIDARPGDALSELDLSAYDAALCATHLYDEDQRCLTRLAPSSIAFVGLLGPAVRRDELLGELPPALAANLRDRLEGPVGLMLHSHGPESVALSIAARLTQVFAGA